MDTIEYFKLQAKNLYKDFKTQKPYFDEEFNDYFYEYVPKYFDVGAIILDFDIDEDNFSLMNAQHIIAQTVGFNKWTELIKASEPELELAKLFFDNQHLLTLEDWEIYLSGTEEMNQTKFDSEFKVELFKQVVLELEIFEDSSRNYLLIHKWLYTCHETEFKLEKLQQEITKFGFKGVTQSTQTIHNHLIMNQ